MCDLALAATIVREESLAGHVGWHLTCFGDPNAYTVGTGEAPKQVETVANCRVINGRTILAGVSGGVSVDPGLLLPPAADARRNLRQAAQSAPPPAPPKAVQGRDAWWWGRAVKGDDGKRDVMLKHNLRPLDVMLKHNLRWLVLSVLLAAGGLRCASAEDEAAPAESKRRRRGDGGRRPDPGRRGRATGQQGHARSTGNARLAVDPSGADAGGNHRPPPGAGLCPPKRRSADRRPASGGPGGVRGEVGSPAAHAGRFPAAASADGGRFRPAARLEHRLAEISWRYRTAERAEAYFQAHRRQFDGTELAVSQVLLSARARRRSAAVAGLLKQAEAIRAEIADGKTSFADAARKHSAAPSAKQDGRLGWIGRHGPMDEAFSQAAFALEKRTDKPAGADAVRRRAVARCDDVRPGSKSLADARTEVDEALAVELPGKLSETQRRLTAVKYTGAMPHFRPGTREVVEH